jgi:hypothetical protein
MDMMRRQGRCQGLLIELRREPAERDRSDIRHGGNAVMFEKADERLAGMIGMAKGEERSRAGRH